MSKEVEELADLTVRDIRLQPPALAVLTGNRGKTRHVPPGQNTTALLHVYVAEHRLSRPGHDDAVFVSQHGSKLSHGGIACPRTPGSRPIRRPGGASSKRCGEPLALEMWSGSRRRSRTRERRPDGDGRLRRESNHVSLGFCRQHVRLRGFRLRVRQSEPTVVESNVVRTVAYQGS